MKTKKIEKIIPNAEAMQALGAELASQLKGGDVVFFQGELGAGKTTLIRGILQALGHTGFVKSPSYSLVELYQLAPWRIVHIDLYRLVNPSDIYHLGLNDYLDINSILLIEWPENAISNLPKPTLCCKIEILDQQRRVKLAQ